METAHDVVGCVDWVFHNKQTSGTEGHGQAHGLSHVAVVLVQFVRFARG